MRKNRGRLQNWRAFFRTIGLDGREATRAARNKIKEEEKDRQQLLETENTKIVDTNELAPPADKKSVANSPP